MIRYTTISHFPRQAQGSYNSKKSWPDCTIYYNSSRILLTFNHSILCSIIKFDFVTDDLSMDPRVRRSPYHDPPENEVFLSQKDIIYVRARRVLFLIGHLFCLHALYLVFSGQVHRYTLFWCKYQFHAILYTYVDWIKTRYHNSFNFQNFLFQQL